jgi:hypothetical protein
VAFAEDFSILPTKAECLMVRLSFFEAKREDSEEGVAIWGREVRVNFARAVVRFLLITGA